ncbi:MAG: helix-hairpin-helix domain-containing protein [Deltaproteobacteria bacterium]|nr:helix-hairpin-helix domain-containing protein [Deltaproteobacteria bacterium]MBW2360784.1 helix-hairpin-helix domain-containing protein [Deltaproteobacteria bacterium]
MFHPKKIRSWRTGALALVSAFLLAVVAVAADSAPLTGTVNVNTASIQELQLLPGVGEARASALVTLRKQRGGFESLDEIKDVKGIGDAGLDRMRPYVRLDGKTTAKRP